MKLNKFEPNRDIQRLFKKTLFNAQLDYEVFSFENKIFWDKKRGWDRYWYKKFIEYCSFFWKWVVLDGDNSNEAYFEEYWMTVTKNKTPRGFFYNFSIVFAWKSVNIFTIEEFNAKGLTNECWRLIFRGAFYYFQNEIPDFVLEAYSKLKNEWKLTINSDNQIIKRTRVDVAFDFDFETFDYAKFVKKSVNSKTAIKAYNPNDNWLYTGIQYLPVKSNKWYWFRIYDKKRDTIDKWKQFWYWDSLNDYQNWNRIEYEIYPPYSNQCTDEELFAGISNVLLWTEKVEKKIIWKPKSQYNVENSLKNFQKYASNHWVGVWQALIDLNNEFFRSEKISITQKLDVCYDSILNGKERLNTWFMNDREPTELEKEEVLMYLETDKWKDLLKFFAPFFSKFLK